ncbi:MAG: T9SS type B sorting domain-containing protein, partial [Flavobacteriales bacterium]|nr:T9SS type B sorting domain-containing protein [Flavobacteriales bacterium]
VTDAQGVITAETINVLVSTVPNFSASGTLETDFCGGEEIFLTGEYEDASETISGAAETDGTFYAGGIVAGQTYLPDGSGDSYTTTIEISSFPPGQLIENATDIIEICLNMEHSYLGDLQAYLECPDGTQITLFEGYNNGGGGTYLGDPIDDFNGGGPGIGWDYCFNDNGDMTLMEANTAGVYTTTTIEGGNSISPGTYQPEDSFDAFIGCPINGEWTITITDNLGIDDGYIFEWSILFDPTINPNVEDYTPVIVDAYWDIDETIINTTETGIFVVPDGDGLHSYTFNVFDNFGCEWDTTITIDVLPALDVWAEVDEPFQAVCGLEVDMDMLNTVNGGFWSYSEGPDDAPIITELSDTESTIEVGAYGQYVFVWQDDYCELDVFATVDFLAAPSITDSDVGPFCPDEESALSIEVEGDWESITWMTNGDVIEEDVLGIVVDSTAVYTVEMEGCGQIDTETFVFETFDCVVVYPNVFTPNSDGWNNALIFPNISQFSKRELWVYDRWGKLVYHAPTYDNTWDGGDLTDGTYWYILDLEGQEPIKTHLTLIRQK